MIEYIQGLTDYTAHKSTCLKGQVGCIITNKDFEIISTGYNGAPRGLQNCGDVGCLLDEYNKCIRTVHAEQNAICQAAKRGVSIQNSIVWITKAPCIKCAQLLIQCNIKAVIYKTHKHVDGLVLLEEARIKYSNWNDALEFVSLVL